MAAYLGYTLWMKMLFRGWPIMVHDMYTRRRRRRLVSQETASSSAECSRNKTPFSFVRGQDLTIIIIIIISKFIKLHVCLQKDVEALVSGEVLVRRSGDSNWTMWDIVWVSPQGHRLVSASHLFLLQIPHCPCSVRKRFSRDYCCWGRSKPGCRIVELHTRWELTTWADFQLCLHRLFISAGCKFSYSGFLDVSHRNGGLRISGWNWLTECWWGHIIEAVVNVGTVV